jgi:hypothetical protein
MANWRKSLFKSSISTVIATVSLIIISLLVNKEVDWKIILGFAIVMFLCDLFVTARTIGYLNLYIYYPIIQSNGSRSNPFKVEGKTNEATPIKLKTNEKITFHVYVPIEQVFGKSTLLDFENPSIEFNGFDLEGNKEIPFTLGGNLSVYLEE